MNDPDAIIDYLPLYEGAKMESEEITPEEKRAQLDAEDLAYEKWCEEKGYNPVEPHWDEFWDYYYKKGE